MRRISWILLITALLIFLLAMIYNRHILEGFDADTAAMLSNLAKASQNEKGTGSYNTWVGWLYANPEKSGAALNDFKKRVFQPDCKFRSDWSTNPPPGKNIPIAPESADLANTGYNYFLKGLANGNQVCISSLDDAKERFMEPGCNFLRHEDANMYKKDYHPVFS